MVSRKKVTIIAVLVFIIIGFLGAITGVGYIKSDGYCRYCHNKPDVSNDSLAIRHYSEDITCFDCHYTRNFIDARMNEVLNYTLGYAGRIGGKIGDSDCQKCHYGNITTTVLPHYYVTNCTACHHGHWKVETELSNESSNTTLDCYICHAPKQLGGQHAELDCIDCHSKYIFDDERHAYIPECIECHLPHTRDMKNRSDCSLCHSGHSPQNLKSFSQNIPKAFCESCHFKEYNNLTGNNQKHNSFYGSRFNSQEPDWYLKFNYSCAGCHPQHASALKCSARGCHYDDHTQVHGTDCLSCHKTGYPPAINCTDCHPDPHAPKPGVGYKKTKR